MDKHSKLGLALSGGGVRAIAFHSGVLRCLAEQGLFSRISHVSSVSGGSLLIGLVYRYNNWCWPTDEVYRAEILPKVRSLITNTSLQREAVKRLIRPNNWKYLLTRANVLSETLQSCWGINISMCEVPSYPMWSINGTTAETGRRFRFKNDVCGDYELGYAEARHFKLADALSVSAAFPVGIGPFTIDPSDFRWSKRTSWGAPHSSIINTKPMFPKLHLYDGGVYDNLGTEPLFDSGSQQLKGDINSIIVSDAGSPFSRIHSLGVLNPFRLKRILDITMEQTRALRIRVLVNSLISNEIGGQYIQIGSLAKVGISKYHHVNPSVAASLLRDHWLNDCAVLKAQNETTHLRCLSLDTYMNLERHGYETTHWNLLLFSNQDK